MRKKTSVSATAGILLIVLAVAAENQAMAVRSTSESSSGPSLAEATSVFASDLEIRKGSVKTRQEEILRHIEESRLEEFYGDLSSLDVEAESYPLARYVLAFVDKWEMIREIGEKEHRILDSVKAPAGMLKNAYDIYENPPSQQVEYFRRALEEALSKERNDQQ